MRESAALTRLEIILLICFSLVGGVTQLAWYGKNPNGGIGGESIALATSQAERGTFADPYMHTGATVASAHVTPLFPLALAVVFRLFGPASKFVLLALSLLGSGLNAGLLPFVSRRLLDSAAPGFLAAAVVVILPVYEIWPSWDSIYSADLIMAGVVVFLSRYGNSPWVAGSMIGILFLLNPVAGVVMLIFAAWILSGRKRAPRFFVSSAAMFAVILLPWIVRNYREFHRFIPLRDDLGIALYSSNNPCAQATLVENMDSGCHAKTHPNDSIAENRLVTRLGEVEYNKVRLHSAWQWIAGNPGSFARLTGERFLYFWAPVGSPTVWSISLSGFAGLILLFKRDPRTAKMFATALAAGSFIYYFIEGQARYRFPVYWCVCLCGGYFVVSLVKAGGSFRPLVASNVASSSKTFE